MGSETWSLGGLALHGRAVLAPLAGVGNLVFRSICRKLGASLVCSEMMSCHGLMRHQPNTWRLLAVDPGEHPVSLQLFGADPEVMARACGVAAEAGADLVDLNFGCPAPKVVRHRGGSALLRDPELLQRIVAACVAACPRPVTVKIRLGWDRDIAVELARRIEDAGAAALAVHGRTRSQGFSGTADWEAIARVVQAVKLPVIGNGDVRNGADAARLLAQTGCAAVMIGRASLGRPWVFRQVNHFLATGETLPEPEWPERLAVIREHHAGLKRIKNERTARLEMRRHTAWYLAGLPGAAAFRRQVNTCETEAEFLQLLETWTPGGSLDKA